MPLTFAFDVPTVVAMTVALCVVLGGTTLLSWLKDRKQRALLYWSCASGLVAVCVTLLAFRGRLPNLLTIELGHGLAMCAAGCCLACCRAFHGRATPLWAIVLPGLLWLALCRIPIVATDVSVRVILLSLMIPAILWLCAYEIWRGRGERLVSRWPTILTLALYGAALFSRIPALVLLQFPSPDFFFQSWWFAAVQISSAIFVTMMSFNVLALHRERMEAGYRHSSRTDSLTQLLTRRAFVEESEALFAQNQHSSAAILLLDLDAFKNINDRFGHLAGDAVLQVFADTVRSGLRGSDIIGRFGGEEFAILLPRQSASEAAAVAERLRRSFEIAALNVGGVYVGATLSAGVAAAENKANLVALLSAADRALYTAKEAGRNCVRIAAPQTGLLAAPVPQAA